MRVIETLTTEQIHRINEGPPGTCANPECPGKLPKDVKPFGNWAQAGPIRLEQSPDQSEFYCPVEHRSWRLPSA